MSKTPSYIFVLTAFLVIALMVVALAYVWFPDSVSAQTVVKVGVSFAVVLIGSVALSLLGKCMGHGHGGGCCPHKKKDGEGQAD